MSTYITMGNRSSVGKIDTTGLNPGNWTVVFDLTQLNITTPYFEVYKMIVKGAAGSSFQVWVDNNIWDISNNGQLNANDMNQPLQLIPGQVVYFMYSDLATDGNPPKVTMWLRYDADIAANRKNMNYV